MIDTAAPRVVSVVRQTPSSTPTNANSLTWRVTFDEDAANGDGDGNDDLTSRRLELKLGYGFSAFGDRFTWTPEVGVGLSDTGRNYRFGKRQMRGAGADGSSLELFFEARRRESANDNIPPEHQVGLRPAARFRVPMRRRRGCRRRAGGGERNPGSAFRGVRAAGPNL